MKPLLSLLLIGLLFLPKPARGGQPPVEIDLSTTLALLELLLEADPDAAAETLRLLQQRTAHRQFSDEQLTQLSTGLKQTLDSLLSRPVESNLSREAVCLAASLGRHDGLAIARRLAFDAETPSGIRIRMLAALIAAADADAPAAAAAILALRGDQHREFHAQALGLLAELDSPRVPEVVFAHYHELEPELRPRAIELLTQRVSWSHRLLEEITAEALPKDALNANQIARLKAAGDEQIGARVKEIWGVIRAERNPDRERVIAETAVMLAKTPGDFQRGAVVFHRVCGQCHTIHGRGEQVGPDITSNGRGSFEQLLSNVLDPSLVIGGDYQARTVFTADGRVLTGLLAEDSPAQIVLKIQGGKLETIPRDHVEEVQVSRLSLMPEGIEKQLDRQELADLFHFLAWDHPPNDPEARWLPGTPPRLMGE